MKALFYIGLLFLAFFEILQVYFIMPFPGSQEMDHLEWAYFLHSFRWYIRIILGIGIIAGGFYAFKIRKKWMPILALIPCMAVIYFVNFKMQADKMFKGPQQLIMANKNENKVDPNSLVIGIEVKGEAKAYPIKFLAYHHLVYDEIGGQSFMITYCSVCHSGRIFASPAGNPKEKFRLVGMDHFNAMFEDQRTKSWWRQATGECIIGKRKGEHLKEMIAYQTTVEEWFIQYPNGKIMQADPSFIKKYDLTGKFEQGKETGSLERTDTVPWQNKSLVIGVSLGSTSKAYDWRELLKKRIINDTIAGQKIVLVVYPDNKSFGTFYNSTGNDFELHHDTLTSGIAEKFSLNGTSLIPYSHSLQPIYSYQEFWHSWKFFHSGTLTYHH